MKKTIFTLLFIASVFTSLTVHSQTCAVCATTDTISTPGFINLDSIPCIVQNQAYDYAIPVHMYSTFSVGPLTVNIDSIEFLAIDSMPCGLCWNSSQPGNTFAAGQNGCIRISGTSNDSAGQYDLAISLKAYFTEAGSPESTLVPPSTVKSSGIRLILRLISSSGTCNPVDTSSAAHNLTTDPSRCITAVNNVPGNISMFDVYPNPVNSSSLVSFTAIKGGTYTLRLTDVAGKTIRSQQMAAHTGVNTTELQRQSLPAGIYFISIGNDEGMVTKKMMVTE